MYDSLIEKPPEYFEALIKLFVVIYERIITSENDVGVLLELQKCLQVYIEWGEISIKKNFGLIFPYLFFSEFELNHELASMSRGSLKALLKDDSKKAKALFVYREKYLSLLTSLL